MNDYQGKRRDQVETSYRIGCLSVLAVFWLIIFLVIFGCTRTEPDFTYTIHRGDHFASPGMAGYDGDTLRRLVTFDESCQYDESSQGFPGWNKVGYWYCLPHPHIGKGGVTFVWRCISGQLTLGWYGWKDGVSPMDTGWDGSQFGLIGPVDPGREYLLEIVSGDSIEFRVDGIGVKTGFSFRPKSCLPPHFGGQETAPHEMKLKIVTI
jgi:hypothetical protein